MRAFSRAVTGWAQGSVAGKCNERDLPNSVKCSCLFKKVKHCREGRFAASFSFETTLHDNRDCALDCVRTKLKMADSERDSGNAQRPDETQDRELEHLSFLILEDETDDNNTAPELSEVEENIDGPTTNLTDAAKRVKLVLCNEFKPVLERLSDPEISLDDEASMAKQLADKLDFQNRSETMNAFICKVSDALGKIYENANVKKIGKELKFIELEKNFVKLRSALSSNGIQEVWENVLSDVLLSEKGDNTKQIVLQHVLQHCWAVLLDNICFERKVADQSSSLVSEIVPEVEEEAPAILDEDEHSAILKHGGWAIKRARDTIIECPEDTITVQFTDVEVELTKNILLSVIKLLGNDIKNSEDGRYLFVPNKELASVLNHLHETAGTSIKIFIQEANENAPSLALSKLSDDKKLHKLWNDVLCKESFDDASKLYVLHQVCYFFIKSKQKAIIQSMGLNPNKKV